MANRMFRLVLRLALSMAFLSGAKGQEWPEMLLQVIELGNLVEAPEVFPAEGFAADGIAQPMFFEGLPWKGNETRVFAWLGIPENKKSLPGVVLVHGGGGSAFVEWVEKWNERGFAAISIAVEGQTDVRSADNKKWETHAWAGPARSGIYGDTGEPLEDQWMYHAVAGTILANSLLRSMPEVDDEKVGLMGISWGGIITSTVIGIDSRFAFAIPTYGCGFLAEAPNQYQRALQQNEVFRKVWDPAVRFERVRMPTLWLTWTGDRHFPMDCFAKSYRATQGGYSVAMIPTMRHGHGVAWNRPESYAFAEGILKEGKLWCEQTALEEGVVTFRCTKPISQARLMTTTDEGPSWDVSWEASEVGFRQEGEMVTVSIDVPQSTKAWYVNLLAGNLVASSEYQEVK